MEIFVGIILGGVLSYWGMSFFNKKQGAQKIERQSVILIEKIKSVCKLISVEGDFAEIYHYEDTKNHFLKLISSKKKAILLINAKAHVGFDLSQIKLEANNKTKELAKGDIINLISSQFPGFTYYEATGYWEWEKEKTAIVEICIPEGNSYMIKLLIDTLKEKLDQDKIGLQILPEISFI